MSKRLDVLRAVYAMVEAALPGIDILGLENAGAAPERIPPNGRIVIRAGDPGEPATDLSPLVYNYEHRIPIEISAYESSSQSSEEVIDAIVEDLSDAIAADRFLGGMVDFLDGYSPATDDLYVAGAEVARSADLMLIASYSTNKPL